MINPTKVLFIPSRPNRTLVNALLKGYIDEGFQQLSNSIAVGLGNHLAQNNIEFNQAVFRTLNNIVLDNVMHYLTSGESYHFATVIGYNQFISNCHVRIKYLDEFFTKWSVFQEDKEEIEREVVNIMLTWLSTYYCSCSDEINTSLLELYEAMTVYTPYRYVRTYRFEVDPELRPLLIYTDCIGSVNETLAVH